jgi:hypothetical protein
MQKDSTWPWSANLFSLTTQHRYKKDRAKAHHFDARLVTPLTVQEIGHGFEMMAQVSLEAQALSLSLLVLIHCLPCVWAGEAPTLALRLSFAFVHLKKMALQQQPNDLLR